ncbi:MAG: ATP-dependent DNA helicase [Bacteroidota bacterium]
MAKEFPLLDRAAYNERFLEELQRLNAEQREAVEQIEGPMMVLAGPGTGKTQMLSARIGFILLHTDTQASNILCLTFTEAGVMAMRQRLLSFIGPEAYKVHIYTFHSFCNSVIRDNLEWFGRRDLEPISEIERIELIRDLIDELPFDHPVKKNRSDIYFYEGHLFELFKQMKAENWNATQVAKQADSFIEDLPNKADYVYQINRGNFKKGSLKEAKVKDTQRRMELLKAAAALYPRYLAMMRKARRYDYEDMILWVLNAFQQNELLLRSYQERYLYLLVDEYQDTNGAQNELLHQLVAYWSKPNIFVVGDDDQSIYEFQGARLQNIVDFYKTFQEDLKLVVLKNNYRSSQAILDAAQSLIVHNENRILNLVEAVDLQKQLEAHHPLQQQITTKPVLKVYKNRTQEIIDLVENIKKIHKNGLAWSSIGIIYAKHRQADVLVTLLEKEQIPYTIKRDLNVLKLPLIRTLIDLLTFFNTAYHNSALSETLLFKLMHLPFWNIPPALIARLSIQLNQVDESARPDWRSILNNTAWLQNLGVKDVEPFLQLHEFIENGFRQLSIHALPTFVEWTINQSGLLQFILKDKDDDLKIQALRTFLDFVKNEGLRRPDQSLDSFLGLIDQMKANRLSLPMYRSTPQLDGVHLLTAHSSKGLEFDHVYMFDCVKDEWEPRGRGSAFRFVLPETLTYSTEEDPMEARRRLFFVSMTRAKSYLQLSYSLQKPDGKELQHARFIDELMLANSISLQEVGLEDQLVIDYEKKLLQDQVKLIVEKPAPGLMESFLEKFRLSISSLNSYLKCPLGFYYEYVLQVPIQYSNAAYFGIAIHNALQRIFEMRKKDKPFESSNTLLRLFEQEMNRFRGQLSPAEYDRRLKSGKKHLAAYYKFNVGEWPKNYRVELPIRNIELEGVPLVGVIDRIDWLDGKTARVLDYKTGRIDAARMKAPNEKEPYGGIYWRQLHFYAILYQQAKLSSRKLVSGTISHIEPDKNDDYASFSLDFNQEGLRFMSQLIQKTYQSIRNFDFDEDCDERDCHWCNFLKNAQQLTSFSDTNTELLDD